MKQIGVLNSAFKGSTLFKQLLKIVFMEINFEVYNVVKCVNMKTSFSYRNCIVLMIFHFYFPMLS